MARMSVADVVARKLIYPLPSSGELLLLVDALHATLTLTL